MVVACETTHSAAVRGDLHAEATIAPEEVDRIIQELESHGRSRIALQSAILNYATLSASYTTLFQIV